MKTPSRRNMAARFGALAITLAAGGLVVTASPALAGQGQPAGQPACMTTCAETRFLEVDGVRYAYRVIGPDGGVPVVFMQRFRGTMDEWDPAFVDVVASQRRVILFDNVGVARTNGTSPPRLADWADNAAAFIKALGYGQVDVLGFSIGGYMAQELTLRRPDLVRRLVLAGSGAGYVEGSNVPAAAIAVATRPINDASDFLYLFFKDTPTSQAAGRDHLARLNTRRDAFQERVSAGSWQAMLSAASDVSTPETSLLTRASQIHQPVLIANGDEDIMIPTYQSYALAQVIPNARLIIYPDSGHAFLFQYPRLFGEEVVRFLAD
ncbi:MAG: alpha/beta hydrolase [Brevundimonas sp.]|nr:alpha/beta hydrolase [Brevundimonas sp.]